MKLHDDLGVSEDADDLTIRKAHRALVRKHHPDVGGDEAAFRAAQHAYDVLSDPDKRAHYERTGDDGSAGPVNDRRNQAMSMVSQAVIQACENDAAGAFDMIKHIRQTLQTQIAQLNGQLSNNKNAVKKFERNRKRWKRKAGAGADILGPILDARARDLEGIRVKITETIEVHKEALAMLDGYEYEMDANSSQVSQASVGGVFGPITFQKY